LTRRMRRPLDAGLSHNDAEGARSMIERARRRNEPGSARRRFTFSTDKPHGAP
jgi:hypothetical protein